MDYQPTCLHQPSLYDHANQPEWISVRRIDLENCLRTIIEKTMVKGGIITQLTRDCMLALDVEAAKEG